MSDRPWVGPPMLIHEPERTSQVAFNGKNPNQLPGNRMGWRHLQEDTPSPPLGMVDGISTPLSLPLNTSTVSSETTESEPSPTMKANLTVDEQISPEEMAQRLNTSVEQLPEALMKVKEEMERKVQEVQRFAKAFGPGGPPKNRAERRARKFRHHRLHG